MTAISPSAGYVLIRDKKTEKLGDFVIVDEDKKEGMIGKVLKCGDPEIKHDTNGIHTVPCPCKEDDTIIYPKYHSSSFSWQGEEYKIVEFHDVLGVIK